MSNLLSQASLVMIPSGYKEDVVYSPIPTDGSGDLSFTRASNGTRINSAGLVEVTPWNLLEQSNTFNASPWAMNVTSGQAGKDGQNNAWLLTKSGATTSDYYTSNVYNGDQTFTIYVKKESGKGFKLFPIGTTTTNTEVNLQTGVVLNQGAGITSTTVEAYSSTWWKISVALNMINSNYYIYVTDGAGTQIASSITIQDAQVNIGLTAKPYFPTTDRLNVPRLTYQNGGGGCPSLLLEKQSTNYFPYSQSVADWYEPDDGVTLTSNTTDTVSPDGTYNASKITIVGGSQRNYQITNSVSGVGTFSAYVKAGTSSTLALYTSSASLLIGYNLSTLAVTQTTGTGTMTSVGNGWYRITATNTLGANEVLQVLYTGNANETIYIWGFQVEASSYPTSYIPTTSASATRVADDITNTFLQSGGFLGSDKGAMFVSGIPYSLLNNQVLNFVLTADNNTTKAFLFDTISNQIRIRTWDASSNMQSLTSGTITGNYKLCVSWTSSSIKFFVNGSLIGTISQTTYPYTTIKPESTSYSNNIWSQLTFFANNLADADAIALTTI